jgi:hypothetical protein
MNLYSLARLLIFLGFALLVSGGVLFLLARSGVSLANLPGTIRIERGNFTCVFALGASILLSILLTLGLNILARFLNK